jgi:hypothetical protein
MKSVDFPETGQLVVILADGAASSVFARVSELEPERMKLVPEADQPERPAKLAGLVTIEWASKFGMARGSGRALEISRGLDSIEVELIGEPVVLQRRGYARVPVALPVALRQGAGLTAAAQVENLSASGLRVSAPELELELGEELELTLRLEYDSRISALARVAVVASDGTYALGFERITASDREKLIRLVADRMEAIAQAEQLPR